MANGGRDAVITITATNNIQTTISLEQRIQETKWLLHPSAGNSSCCIFRLPQYLLEINKKAYQPHIVSIGPYHYGDTHLDMMQQHKWRFLRDLLVRTPSPGPNLDDYRQLHLAGIKFKKREANSFLDIRFCNGVLEIPNITLDDLRTDIFLNLVAFEQCYSHCSKHITTYAALMSCLISTPVDAAFLSDKNIIENYLGTDEEVAHFFKNLGKDVPFDIDESYLCKLFKDVNEYHRNIWHVRWAGFRFKYFDNPWSFLSAVAAVVLLLLTAIQTLWEPN
ncbi:hypothetical protein L3X38_039223 [Prunus dulcis]|uniref:Uncharacterized protein n=1 Tax=Prunus dulcis TaxID=3755 RepID=A0AAD4V6K7_PRUDU|nr:hypothetical protein L3X38_039223 [Prunus dulcis]